MENPGAKLFTNPRRVDSRDQMKLEHKKMMLRTRMDRVQQPRATSIALDIEGIQKQVNEKMKSKCDEEDQITSYEKFLQKTENVRLLDEFKLSKKQENEKRSLIEFWKHQEEEKLKKIPNHREGDLQHSSELKFCGEDPLLEDVLAMKKQQTKQILEDQIISNKTKNSQIEQDKRVCMFKELEEVEYFRRLHEEQKRKTLMDQKSLRKANEDLMEEKRKQKIAIEEMEKKMKDDHIQHFMNSTLLTEDPLVARSYSSPKRVLTERWKGMTAQERNNFKVKLLEQVQENQERAKKEIVSEKMFEKTLEDLSNESEKIHLKFQIKKRSLEMNMMLENQRLREIQKVQREKEEKERNTNVISDEFFQKFGRHAR